MVVMLLACIIVFIAAQNTSSDRKAMKRPPMAEFEAGPAPIEVVADGCKAWCIFLFWCVWAAIIIIVFTLIAVGR